MAAHSLPPGVYFGIDSTAGEKTDKSDPAENAARAHLIHCAHYATAGQNHTDPEDKTAYYICKGWRFQQKKRIQGYQFGLSGNLDKQHA